MLNNSSAGDISSGLQSPLQHRTGLGRSTRSRAGSGWSPLLGTKSFLSTTHPSPGRTRPWTPSSTFPKPPGWDQTPNPIFLSGKESIIS